MLANDSDPNGDPLTAVKASDPTHGTLTLSPDGSFAYTPNDGKADGNSATVTITV